VRSWRSLYRWLRRCDRNPGLFSEFALLRLPHRRSIALVVSRTCHHVPLESRGPCQRKAETADELDRQASRFEPCKTGPDISRNVRRTLLQTAKLLGRPVEPILWLVAPRLATWRLLTRLETRCIHEAGGGQVFGVRPLRVSLVQIQSTVSLDSFAKECGPRLWEAQNLVPPPFVSDSGAGSIPAIFSDSLPYKSRTDAGPTPRNLTVCLVDDDLSVLKATGRLLSFAGWSVEPFADPVAFLRYAEIHHPRVVVLDIRMSPMNGLEVQTRLQRLSPATRVIILTSKDDPLVRSRAINAGASAFFLKPAGHQDFLASVRSAFAED